MKKKQGSLEPTLVKSASADAPVRPSKRLKISHDVPPPVISSAGLEDYGTLAGGPFADYRLPLPEHCEQARDDLAALHSYDTASGATNTGLERAEPKQGVLPHDHSQQTVLDSLIRTILSQNTTDKTSLRAFTKLKEMLPSWEAVLGAPSAVVEDAIREGGLAEIKAARIKTILQAVRDEEVDGPSAPLSLEYMRLLPTEKVRKVVPPSRAPCVDPFTPSPGQGRADAFQRRGA